MENTLRRSSRIIITLVAIALIISLAAGFGIFYKKSHADNSAYEYRSEYATTKRDTKFTFSSDGTMQIERNRVQDQTEGEDTWTVLVYMCGTDLESVRFDANKTLEDMRSCAINSTNSKNLNLLVQTGGTAKWNGGYSWIDSSKIQRHVLSENGKYSTIDTLQQASMGDPNTLNNFIEWGLTNYPAERTAIVFYNHGSNTTNGICFDELHNKDSLLVDELEYALAASKDKMKDTFDLIVFDTCLTGTLEYANALAPYVDFMFASAEAIPTGSFKYKKLFNTFLENPSVSNKDALTILRDEYLKQVKSMNLSEEMRNSLCVQGTDLTQIDDLIIEFNKAFKILYDKAKVSKREYKKIYKGMCGVASYMHESQLDIGNFIYNIDEYDTSEFQKAMDKVRVCWVDGYDTRNNMNVSQLSFFFHLEPFIYYYDRVRNIYTSPYLLNLLELTGHMTAKNDFDTYKEYDWASSPFFYEDNFDFLNYKYYANTTECKQVLSTNNNYYSFLQNWIDNSGNVDIHDRTPSQHIETEIDGTTISCVVNGESRDSVSAIYNSIFAEINNITVCLGETNTSDYNEETGKVTTNFKGDWLILGDGQMLTCYVNKTTDKYTEYFIPVVIDDTESSIIVHMGDDNYFEIIGVLDSTPHSEHMGKIYPLETGTTLSPIYDIWDNSSESYVSEYGDDYIIKGSNDFLFSTLENGENYKYSTIVKNYYGQTLYSEVNKFRMIDGKIFFNNDNEQ